MRAIWLPATTGLPLSATSRGGVWRHSLFSLEEKTNPRDSFLTAVRKSFIITLSKPLCTDVVLRCLECTNTYIHCRSKGPMRHCFVRRRKNICKKVGIPFVRDIGLEDSMGIEITKFRSITVDLAGTRNCVCNVLSEAFRGTCKKIRSRSGSELSDEAPTDSFTRRSMPPAQSL